MKNEKTKNRKAEVQTAFQSHGFEVPSEEQLRKSDARRNTPIIFLPWEDDVHGAQAQPSLPLVAYEGTPMEHLIEDDPTGYI